MQDINSEKGKSVSKKTFIITIISIVFVAVVAVGATVAYFSSEKSEYESEEKEQKDSAETTSDTTKETEGEEADTEEADVVKDIANLLKKTEEEPVYEMNANGDLKFVLYDDVAFEEDMTVSYEENDIQLDENDIKSVSYKSQKDTTTGQEEYAVVVNFTEEGAQKFGEVTRQHVGEALTIIAGEREISSPVIQAAITDGVAMIAGGFESKDEVSRLAKAISGN